MDEPTRQRIVEMYQAGSKLVDIQAETETPRSTIYYVLDQAGVRANRQRNSLVKDNHELHERVARLEATVVRLESIAKNKQVLHVQLMTLLQQLSESESWEATQRIIGSHLNLMEAIVNLEAEYAAADND